MLKLLILLILLLSFPDETFQFNFRKEKLQFQSFLSKRLHKLPLSKQNAGEIEKPSFLESFIKSQYEISLGAGIMGLVLILLNRSIVWNDGGISVDSFNAVSDIRSRADLIAAIGCTGLLLNIFSDSSEFNFINKEVIDKNIRERDKIALVGHYLAKPLFTALPSLTEVEQERLSWLFEAIQASIPTVTSAHCFDIDRLTVKGVIGVVNLQATQSLLEPDQSDLKSTAKILQSPIAKNEELYLPDLQILPGKIEFTYLPINCQSVFILPLISKKEILVLGTNQAKSLTFDDINKIRVICDLYQDSFTLARSSSLV